MRFLNPLSKYFILTVALSFMSLPIYSLSFTQSVKKAALNKNGSYEKRLSVKAALNKNGS